MVGYRVIAIDQATAASVRRLRKAPGYGHPAYAEVASGFGPCRVCLTRFREDEERRLLFTYNSFAGLEAHPQPGPVFIHEEKCERYGEEQGFPEELHSLPFTFFAYSTEQELVEKIDGSEGESECVLDRLLALPEVAFVQVHNTAAGCYVARIEPGEIEPRPCSSDVLGQCRS